jgi:hypothetical protein
VVRAVTGSAASPAARRLRDTTTIARSATSMLTEVLIQAHCGAPHVSEQTRKLFGISRITSLCRLRPYYEYDDQGALSAERLTATDGTSFVRTTGGSRNTVGAGIRPVFWLTDWLAIQGQAGWDYTTRVRSSSIATDNNGIQTNDTFGRSGNMGIFTIAPTIKPKGGFFTRPEFRLFATYAIWSKSLKGAIGGTQYQDNTQGWLFGVQTEWFF